MLSRFVLAFLVSFVSSSAFAQSYELRCRGGGGLQVRSYLNASDGRVGHHVEINFVRATQTPGPGDLNLRPGECSWLDRVVGPGEPALIYDGKVVVQFTNTVTATGQTLTSFSTYNQVALSDAFILSVFVASNGGALVRDAAKSINIRRR